MRIIYCSIVLAVGLVIAVASLLYSRTQQVGSFEGSSIDYAQGPWGNGGYARFDNPAWSKSYARENTEWRNVYNRPLDYERYSEMGPFEQASPYSQSYQLNDSNFRQRYKNYYRGVIHYGHSYRNARW